MTLLYPNMCNKRCVIKGHFYKELTNSWSLSYNSFVKIHSKKILESQHDCVISNSVL